VGRDSGTVLVADGVVLHQPLKRPILVKNDDFRQNMNGIPVSLFGKTENAPTQGRQNPVFLTPPATLCQSSFRLPYKDL